MDTDSLENELMHADHDTNKVWLYNTLGQIYLRTNPRKAQTYFKAGNSLSIELNFLAGRIDLTKNIGTSFYYLGMLDSCRFYWETVLKLVPKTHIIKKGDALNNMGVITQRMGEVDTSLHYYSEALRLRVLATDTLATASSLCNLAALYRQKGEFQEAIEHYYKALEIYEANDQQKQTSDALNGIGLAYKDLSLYDQSLEYLKRSLKIREELGDIRSISGSLNNIGAIYMALGYNDEAETTLRRYLELCKTMNNYRGEAGAYSNLGKIAKDQGDLDSGLVYYTKAFNLFESLGDKVNTGLVSINIGYIQLSKGQAEKATSSFNTALKYAELQQSLDHQKRIHNGLSEAYFETRDFEKAYAHEQKLSEIKDTLFYKGLEKEIAFYQEKYEAEKREGKISDLEAKVAKDQLKVEESKRLRNTAIGIAVLFICLSLFLFLLYRFRKRIHAQEQVILSKEKEEIERKIELKNRELSAFATHSIQKNEMLNKLLEKLSKLREKDSLTDVIEMERLMKKSINIDADWDTYKRHFLGVYPGFFDHLSQEYPSLSPNDLRVCAYIRMNLATKEIATLMNIAPKSVRMNKYRLKKKLALDESQDIHTFLTSLGTG